VTGKGGEYPKKRILYKVKITSGQQTIKRMTQAMSVNIA
jgi:hypothetical protein